MVVDCLDLILWTVFPSFHHFFPIFSTFFTYMFTISLPNCTVLFSSYRPPKMRMIEPLGIRILPFFTLLFIFYCFLHFKLFYFLFLSYLTHPLSGSLGCWFIWEPLFLSFFWHLHHLLWPTRSPFIPIVIFIFSIFLYLWWSAVYHPTTTIIHRLPFIIHPSSPSLSINPPFSIICVTNPRIFIIISIIIPYCACQDPWSYLVGWELRLWFPHGISGSCWGEDLSTSIIGQPTIIFLDLHADHHYPSKSLSFDYCMCHWLLSSSPLFLHYLLFKLSI